MALFLPFRPVVKTTAFHYLGPPFPAEWPCSSGQTSYNFTPTPQTHEC